MCDAKNGFYYFSCFQRSVPAIVAECILDCFVGSDKWNLQTMIVERLLSTARSINLDLIT